MRLAPLFYVVVTDPVDGEQLHSAVASALAKTIELAAQGRGVAVLAIGSGANTACVQALPEPLRDVKVQDPTPLYEGVRFHPAGSDAPQRDGAVVLALRPKPTELIKLLEDRRVEAVICLPSSAAELRHLQVAFPDSASV